MEILKGVSVDGKRTTATLGYSASRRKTHELTQDDPTPQGWSEGPPGAESRQASYWESWYPPAHVVPPVSLHHLTAPQASHRAHT
ncbi:hypothetical protein NHX12_019103 [Muraenolepis orangiensis]|uniref:Uncharacterized protein n=1 Tax=Muraenolepis orangiensis TaxID=630683 RepID=A0A9Q0EW50_9TELE|nr:hypothetical protein NHX12_019103 [Muraenolepis orangiensis]